ncbi:MAG: hypothetical protein QXV48_03940 [Desulfurococcaceae archaeon]
MLVVCSINDFSITGLHTLGNNILFSKVLGLLGDAEIALLYAVAMRVDAVMAFPIGYLYDLVKYRSLYLAPLFT